ncbi:MarR family winged helix-turn-helix transcriptional regulator [Actinomycetes bacterium M1A6_2h]
MEHDDPRWLSNAEVTAWLTLSSLIEALPAALNAQLKSDVGINYFEYTVLACLSESRDLSATMKDLAAFASGSISRLSHAITRLESQGWVRRHAEREVGGQLVVTLTDAGAELVRRAAPGHVRQVRQLVLDTLGSERLLELGTLAHDVLIEANPSAAQLIDERASWPTVLSHDSEGAPPGSS